MNEIKPKIVVIGVGGAGSNVVAHMFDDINMSDVDFVLCNTDAQALNEKQKQYNALINQVSSSEDRDKFLPSAQFIQLGPDITQGLGAGMNPDVGKRAAKESIDRDMFAILSGADMVFLTAGEGGGTGSGAIPVIAAEAKNAGALTVAVVTTPFSFEGKERIALAASGIIELRESTDAMLVIKNQNLFNVSNASTLLVDAFALTNDILKSTIKAFIDLIHKEGVINLDFADLSAVIKESGGNAVIGTGTASSKEASNNTILNSSHTNDHSTTTTTSPFQVYEEDRALRAAKLAITCPLLDNDSIINAKNIIINISGGENDLKLFEIEAIINYITQANENARIIFGTSIDNDLAETNAIRVSVIATGIPEQKLEDKATNVYNIKSNAQKHYKINEDNESTYNTEHNENNTNNKELSDDQNDDSKKKLTFLEKLMGKNNSDK